MRLEDNMIEVRIPAGDPDDSTIEADLMSIGWNPIHSGGWSGDITIVFVKGPVE